MVSVVVLVNGRELIRRGCSDREYAEGAIRRVNSDTVEDMCNCMKKETRVERGNADGRPCHWGLEDDAMHSPRTLVRLERSYTPHLSMYAVCSYLHTVGVDLLMKC
jgi:hypothetical protein